MSIFYDTWENILKSLRENPTDPCAKYPEIMLNKARYLRVHGLKQLETDFDMAVARSRK